MRSNFRKALLVSLTALLLPNRPISTMTAWILGSVQTGLQQPERRLPV